LSAGIRAKSWIAAGCLARELPLASFNTNDFLDFAEYNGLVLML
jgi:predicted nucleic acid-binding protein